MTLQFDATPEELAVFLAEAEEQIQLLDQDIVILEKEGANPELLQEVFRAAHTLKGSSGAINHQRMASLTHGMESLLDSLRQGKLTTSTALIDLLLQSLDALRVLNEEVETLEHSGLDPTPIIALLRQFLEDNIIEADHATTEVDVQQQSAPSLLSPTTPPNGSNGQSLHIALQIDQECPFPAVRMLQVHLAMAEIGEIFDSFPTRQLIEAEKVSSDLRLTCVTQASIHRIRDLIMAIPDIVAVRISDSSGEGASLSEQDAFASTSLAQGSPGMSSTIVAEGGANAKGGNGQGSDLMSQRRSETKSVPTSKTVRIDVERLDALMNLVGELVIDCTRLVQLSARLQAQYEGEEIAQGVGETSLHIHRITDELQDLIMKARMFPVSSVFNRFPRMMRDLSQKVGKKVEFVMEGEETELDRSVIEEISDPLIHLLRNSVDHGIEPPDVRLACGKPESGLVRLTACHRESRIVLTVEDDGKGIDPERIRQAAIERGVLSAEAASRMGDREVLELIFLAGFSTAVQVSDVSGRGVGMDIVRTNIHKLNGQVSVESTPGRGSRFSLELPLTLAIMDALLVSLDSNIFAIPLVSVTETLRVRLSEIYSVNGEKVIQLRGRVLRLLPLGAALGLPRRDALDRSYVVVVNMGNDQVGIVVDALVGEQQVVIKSLGSYMGDVRGISGATILGDGRVALILDVPALVRKTIQERAGEVVYV